MDRLSEFCLNWRHSDCVRALAAIACCAIALGASRPAQAQPSSQDAARDYPAKAVTFVVPFPAGGGLDVFARTLSEKLVPRLGRPFLVENKPGVGGLAGASAVAKSPPDGYTLLIAANTIVISPHILAKGAGGGVDVLKDLVPVIMPASAPMVLVVTAQLGVKSPAELIALAQRMPGLPYASAGNGTPMHFAGELFKKSTGVDMQHVPYKGVFQSVADALGGQIKVLFTSLGGPVMPHVRSGKLVALAVTEKQRTSIMPSLPTLTELGIRGVEVDAWYGILAPAGTPPAVVAFLNREFNAVLQLPDLRGRLSAAGIDVRGGSADAFGAEIRADHERYGRMAKEFGIRAD